MAKHKIVKEVKQTYYDKMINSELKRFFEFHIINEKHYMIATKNVWQLYG
tara:strand:+ start:1489 stop:1638 length:150 start_codon:yes stop_codon:yes gene_type:complete